MTDDDVPARVMAALQDTHLLVPPAPPPTAGPEWWDRMAAYHEARAQAWAPLIEWADSTRQPVAVRVAISHAAEFETREAQQARREARRMRRDTDH